MRLEELLGGFLKAPSAKIVAQTRLRDLPGWNSFKTIEFVSLLEETYGVSFSIPEVLAMESVADVLEQLRRKGK